MPKILHKIISKATYVVLSGARRIMNICKLQGFEKHANNNPIVDQNWAKYNYFGITLLVLLVMSAQHLRLQMEIGIKFNK